MPARRRCGRSESAGARRHAFRARTLAPASGAARPVGPDAGDAWRATLIGTTANQDLVPERLSPRPRARDPGRHAAPASRCWACRARAPHSMEPPLLAVGHALAIPAAMPSCSIAQRLVWRQPAPGRPRRADRQASRSTPASRSTTRAREHAPDKNSDIAGAAAVRRSLLSAARPRPAVPRIRHHSSARNMPGGRAQARNVVQTWTVTIEIPTNTDMRPAALLRRRAGCTTPVRSVA